MGDGLWQTTPFLFTKYVTLDNSVSGTLNQDLPAGTVRLFTLSKTIRLALFGQGEIKNTRPGDPVEIALGARNNLKLLRTFRKIRLKGDDITRVTFRIQNPTSENISVKVIEDNSAINSQTVFDSTPSPIFENGALVWPLDVTAHAEADIDYSVGIAPHYFVYNHSFYQDLLAKTYPHAEIGSDSEEFLTGR